MADRLPIACRRRHSKAKNHSAQKRKSTPRSNKQVRTRWRYCNDVRAGIHWKKRNKKPCARLPDCVARKYRPRGLGVLPLHFSLCVVGLCLHTCTYFFRLRLVLGKARLAGLELTELPHDSAKRDSLRWAPYSLFAALRLCVSLMSRSLMLILFLP